jgi:hypothetical protein
MLTLLLVALLAGNVQLAAACSGADPAIINAAMRTVTQNGEVNRYTVAITVANQGTATQPGNTLQSVEIYQDGQKVDQKGVPPLRAGQAAVVTYGFDRSRLARERTTDLDFRLVVHNTVPGPAACAVPSEPTHLRV